LQAPVQPTAYIELNGNLVTFNDNPLQTLTVKGPSEKENDLNQIYLSSASVQQALQCTPEEKQSCMSLFHPNPQSGNVPNPPAVPENIIK